MAYNKYPDKDPFLRNLESLSMPMPVDTKAKRSICARPQHSDGSSGGSKSSWEADRTRGTSHSYEAVTINCEL